MSSDHPVTTTLCKIAALLTFLAFFQVPNARAAIVDATDVGGYVEIRASLQNLNATVVDRDVVLEGDQDVSESSYEFRKLEGSCQLVLDFIDFSLAAPAVATGRCIEALRIYGSVTVDNGFTICGPNNGQRIFLSYGHRDSITLEFNTARDGRYRIRARHVNCSDTEFAPIHCLQNFATSTGVIRSFSYGNGAINGQTYTVCIQDPRDSQKVEWLECEEEVDTGAILDLRSQFFLSNYFISALNMPGPGLPAPGHPVLMGMTGPACDFTSFVEVFGEARHCGAKFTIDTTFGQTPVVSRAKPFQLYVNVAGNEYAGPSLMPGPYQPAFPYPSDMATPAPRTSCTAFGTPSGAQGFTSCTMGTGGQCMCMPVPPAVIIDPAQPLRTGFCLKYTLK